MIDVEPQHVCPRPQLVRQGWFDLCGEWRFAFDDEDRGLAEQWYGIGNDDSAEGRDHSAGNRDKSADGRDNGTDSRDSARDPGNGTAFDRTITVPYPPESELSGVYAREPHAIVWYRRQFDAPQLAPGDRLLLHFAAVDYTASVWLNGTFLGQHSGGQTPFVFDVTDVLRGVGQSIVVRAEDRPDDMTQPRGKQDWRSEPHDIWYHRTTGIWQPVWAEVVPALHLADLHWTPDVLGASVACEGVLSRQPNTATSVRVVLRLDDAVLADQAVRVDSDRFRFDVAIPALRHGQDRLRLLWSPENPVLVDASVEVQSRGEPADEVASYVGLRDVGTGDGHFLLNHVSYFPRMVLAQGYWPQSHLAAPDAHALRREVELVKELGFNGVRVHQKVEDPRYLYWCDRLGLLVWGETANAYEFGPVAVERLTREWLEIVRRDRSHPCIVTWVPLNESWGVPDIASSPAQAEFARSLYHLTKSLDPTRPVISNDGWETPAADIYGVHDYAPSGASLQDRYVDAGAVRRTITAVRPGGKRLVLDDPDTAVARPVMLTEFGGLTYAPADGEWFGYSTVTDGADLVRRLDELVGAVLASSALAGFCYTQLTDTLQETNGLLAADRTPKADPAEIRAVLTRPTKALPPDELRAQRDGHAR